MQSVTPHSILERYGNPSAVFDEATIKLPDRPISRGIDVARDWFQSHVDGLIFFLTGSRPRGHEAIVAGWLDELPGWAMMAPATHALRARPSYASPADPQVYQTVHELRLAEIDYCVARLSRDFSILELPTAIIGLSEGAVAALAWSPHRLMPRICLAWSCEDTYFGRLPVLPNDRSTPILNVVGGTDKFFSARNSIASMDGRKDGHGAHALQDFTNSKVVIYPSIGHDLLDHQGLKAEVTSFLKHHLGGTPLNTTRETWT